MLQIRRMRVEDIRFAIRLSNQEKWGVIRRDLARILKLDPSGSFVAMFNGRKVGLLTTTSYGRKLAWIGNVVVDREHRGRHIGQALVQNAIDYLQSNRLHHIALYCFDENVKFYRRLGFIRDEPFVRMLRKPEPLHPSAPPEKTSHPLSLRALYSADRKAFGADRSRLIRLVLKTKAGWYVGSQNHGSPGSYLLVKTYDDVYEFGPWICSDARGQQAPGMLQLALSKIPKKPIEASCLQNHKRALSLLRRNGFEIVRHGYRMYFDEAPSLGNLRANYALGFPDKG